MPRREDLILYDLAKLGAGSPLHGGRRGEDRYQVTLTNLTKHEATEVALTLDRLQKDREQANGPR